MHVIPFHDLNPGQHDNAVRMWIAAGLVSRGVDIHQMVFNPLSTEVDENALAGYVLPRDKTGEVIFALGECEPGTAEFERRVVAARTGLAPAPASG